MTTTLAAPGPERPAPTVPAPTDPKSRPQRRPHRPKKPVPAEEQAEVVAMQRWMDLNA